MPEPEKTASGSLRTILDSKHAKRTLALLDASLQLGGLCLCLGTYRTLLQKLLLLCIRAYMCFSEHSVKVALRRPIDAAVEATSQPVPSTKGHGKTCGMHIHPCQQQEAFYLSKLSSYISLSTKTNATQLSIWSNSPSSSLPGSLSSLASLSQITARTA